MNSSLAGCAYDDCDMAGHEGDFTSIVSLLHFLEFISIGRRRRKYSVVAVEKVAE